MLTYSTNVVGKPGSNPKCSFTNLMHLLSCFTQSHFWLHALSPWVHSAVCPLCLCFKTVSSVGTINSRLNKLTLK